MKDECRRCRFWACRITSVGDWWAADCLRHAPIGLKDRGEAAIEQQTGNLRLAIWPTTRANDWCGDFEPRPAP
jgi:hypothetical protein